MANPQEKPVVLCVDDEKIVLDSLSEQLRKHLGDSYSYEFAESAEEAMEVIQELADEGIHVALVISDQVMPGMLGDEFLTKLHQHSPDTVKILLTGQAALESAINAVNNADLFRYLTKPWKKEDFLLTVERGLDRYFLQQQREKQVECFRKFVPMEFTEILSRESLADIELGECVKRDMSVLFIDIRGFDNLLQQMSPQESFQFLNGYFKRIEPSIRKAGGFVDKYIGDAVMAVFHETAKAVQAVSDVKQTVKEYNQQRHSKGRQPICVSMGIHTGPLMLGIVGVESRMQSTVIADAVNLASRLEGAAKIFGATALVSQKVLDEVCVANRPEGMQTRFLGKVQVKGRQEVVRIHELLLRDEDAATNAKINTKTEFEDALQRYFAKDFNGCIHIFESILQQTKADQATQYYLQRAQHFAQHPPSDSWQGIEMLTVK
ncbi:MAG: adenylate/guanylate cyclase domain-containing protein [Myxococcota bacterium]